MNHRARAERRGRNGLGGGGGDGTGGIGNSAKSGTSSRHIPSSCASRASNGASRSPATSPGNGLGATGRITGRGGEQEAPEDADAQWLTGHCHPARGREAGSRKIQGRTGYVPGSGGCLHTRPSLWRALWLIRNPSLCLAARSELFDPPHQPGWPAAPPHGLSNTPDRQPRHGSDRSQYQCPQYCSAPPLLPPTPPIQAQAASSARCGHARVGRRCCG